MIAIKKPWKAQGSGVRSRKLLSNGGLRKVGLLALLCQVDGKAPLPVQLCGLNELLFDKRVLVEDQNVDVVVRVAQLFCEVGKGPSRCGATGSKLLHQLDQCNPSSTDRKVRHRPVWLFGCSLLRSLLLRRLFRGRLFYDLLHDLFLRCGGLRHSILFHGLLGGSFRHRYAP